MKQPVSDDSLVAPDDLELISLRLIADALVEADDVHLEITVAGTKTSFELPATAADGLERLVSYLAADRAVAMTSYGQTLSTGQAAQLLGMSRQHLVNLLDSGAIGLSNRKVGPGHGSHRRIDLASVVAYNDERRIEADSLAAARGPDAERAVPLKNAFRTSMVRV